MPPVLESALPWSLLDLRATADHQQYLVALVVHEGKGGCARLIQLGLSVVAGWHLTRSSYFTSYCPSNRNMPVAWEEAHYLGVFLLPSHERLPWQK